jgi:hypothetical protein
VFKIAAVESLAESKPAYFIYHSYDIFNEKVQKENPNLIL